MERLTPEQLQAKIDKYVADHDLALPDGMAWSVDGFDNDWNVRGVTAVNVPGFVIPRDPLT